MPDKPLVPMPLKPEKQSERKLTNNSPTDIKKPNETKKQSERKLPNKDLDDIKNNFNNQGSNSRFI